MRSLYALVAAACVLGYADLAHAGSINVRLDEEHQGKGNKGTEFRPVDDLGNPSGLILTALSSIDDHSPFDPYASGLMGSVYVDKDGTGVQAADGRGSKGISGGGGHKDEQLNFTFDAAAAASSIQLGLIQFKPGNRLGKNDDAILFIKLAGDDDLLVLDETDYLSAFVSTGKDKGYVDFGMLGLGDAQVNWFGVRETNGHCEVNSLSYIMVPLPAPLLLGVAGLGVVAVVRRRRLKHA